MLAAFWPRTLRCPQGQCPASVSRSTDMHEEHRSMLRRPCTLPPVRQPDVRFFRQHWGQQLLGPRGVGGPNPIITPPPLAQARPRSQKSGQNGGSTPTPCLDKAVHARDTCDSHAGNNIVSQG